MFKRSATEGADSGFTIVETMIFLAISGLMFVLAVAASSGQQETTEFQTAISTLRSELNQELSNVTYGNYPIDSSLNCTASGGGFNFLAGSSDGTCDIVGELVAFYDNPVAHYTDYPVFGHTFFAPGNQSSSTIAEANPDINSPTYSLQDLPFGLKVVVPTSTPAGAVAIAPGAAGGIGIFDFASFDSAAAGSGSEHIEQFVMPGWTYNSASITIHGLTDDAGICNPNSVCNPLLGGNPNELINPRGGVVFCSQFSNNQSALFTIGGAAGPDVVTDSLFTTSGSC